MPTNAEIAKFEDFGLNDVQRISYRPHRVIEIVEPNPKWHSSFVLIAQRIQAALGGRALAIEHIGSTSVPDLPAKDVIDINLVVADPTAEGDYVRDLEDAGFQFLSRLKVICFSFSVGFFLKKKKSSLTLTRDAVGASLLWPRRAVRQHPCVGP
jgi:GrpB-like predicted nucleotidyltransferase (UPF0157 family)